MPRRSVLDYHQGVKGKLKFTHRRDADIAASQRQATASSEHPTESLVSFGQIIRESRVTPRPSTVAENSSHHALVNPPLIDSTDPQRPPGERVVIPIVSCATSQPDAPTGEAGGQVWYLPGAALGAISRETSSVIGFTPLNVQADRYIGSLSPEFHSGALPGRRFVRGVGSS